MSDKWRSGSPPPRYLTHPGVQRTTAMETEGWFFLSFTSPSFLSAMHFCQLTLSAFPVLSLLLLLLLCILEKSHGFQTSLANPAPTTPYPKPKIQTPYRAASPLTPPQPHPAKPPSSTSTCDLSSSSTPAHIKHCWRN